MPVRLFSNARFNKKTFFSSAIFQVTIQKVDKRFFSNARFNKKTFLSNAIVQVTIQKNIIFCCKTPKAN